MLDEDFFCQIWLDMNVEWLDLDSHYAYLDYSDPARYDMFYVVAFTMFLRDMETLSQIWFELNFRWLDYESHLAYMDRAHERHYPDYVHAYMHFMRTGRCLPEPQNE